MIFANNSLLGSRCRPARGVSDSSSEGSSILRLASSLRYRCVKAVHNVLRPPSSWSASPPLSLYYSLKDVFLQAIMPLYMSKIFHLVFLDSI